MISRRTILGVFAAGPMIVAGAALGSGYSALPDIGRASWAQLNELTHRVIYSESLSDDAKSDYLRKIDNEYRSRIAARAVHPLGPRRHAAAPTN